MTKWILHIALFLIPFLAFSQGKVKEKWESEKDYLEYKKGEKYKGPTDWYGSSPASLKKSTYSSSSSSSSSSSTRRNYTPQQIKRDRQHRYQGLDPGGGSGDLERDPTVERPDPWETESTQAPDVDLPDVNAPSISPEFWKFLLFAIVLALLIFIAYQFIKNRKTPDKKIVVEVEDAWNPEIITKSELELRLEAAMEKGDYRECIRIYFTFILKELIRKSWIFWKKEKTNYDYVLEMRKKSNRHLFEECVRIYDLVWYGEYEIDKDIYLMIQPTMEQYYKSLKTTSE